jgi:hypothetical protein
MDAEVTVTFAQVNNACGGRHVFNVDDKQFGICLLKIVADRTNRRMGPLRLQEALCHTNRSGMLFRSSELHSRGSCDIPSFFSRLPGNHSRLPGNLSLCCGDDGPSLFPCAAVGIQTQFSDSSDACRGCLGLSSRQAP